MRRAEQEARQLCTKQELEAARQVIEEEGVEDDDDGKK